VIRKALDALARAAGLVFILAAAPGCITAYAYDHVALVERERVGDFVAIRVARVPEGGGAVVDVVTRRKDGTLLAYHVERWTPGDDAVEGESTESAALPPGGLPLLFDPSGGYHTEEELARGIDVFAVAADGRIEPAPRQRTQAELSAATIATAISSAHVRPTSQSDDWAEATVGISVPPAGGRKPLREMLRSGDTDAGESFQARIRGPKLGSQILHTSAFVLLVPFTIAADAVLWPFEWLVDHSYTPPP
jgi:hypothetical protein